MAIGEIFAASYPNLRWKPKFRRLVRATGLCEAMVKGALQFLWEYVIYSTDGKLKLDSKDIPYILGLPDDIAISVFDAMIKVGFIDRTDDGLVIHDWEENKSPYLIRLENERIRRARKYQRKRKSSENLITTRAQPVETKPNQTKPNHNTIAYEGDRQHAHDAGKTTMGTQASNDRRAQIKAFREQLLANVAEMHSEPDIVVGEALSGIEQP